MQCHVQSMLMVVYIAADHVDAIIRDQRRATNNDRGVKSVNSVKIHVLGVVCAGQSKSIV